MFDFMAFQVYFGPEKHKIMLEAEVDAKTLRFSLVDKTVASAPQEVSNKQVAASGGATRTRLRVLWLAEVASLHKVIEGGCDVLLWH
jgi:hypothetical protein